MFEVDPFGRCFCREPTGAGSIASRRRRKRQGAAVNRPFPRRRSPIRLNPSFAFTSAGDEVLYRADQETTRRSSSSRPSRLGQEAAGAVLTTLVEVPALAASEGHDQIAPLPLSSAAPLAAGSGAGFDAPRSRGRALDPLDDLRRAVQFTPRSASLSYFDDGRGLPHGQNVFRDHEDLVRLGIHPALQLYPDGMTYTR
jgi:hypothetical protein